MVQVDLTDVETGPAGPFEEGIVEVKVDEVSHKKGKDSGEPYLSWEFEIQSGPDSGRKVFHNTSLQKKALFSLKRVLEALKPDSDWDRELDTEDVVREAPGETCRAYLEPDEYEGSFTANLTRFYQPGEDPVGVEEASASDSEDNEEEDDIPF